MPHPERLRLPESHTQSEWVAQAALVGKVALCVLLSPLVIAIAVPVELMCAGYNLSRYLSRRVFARSGDLFIDGLVLAFLMAGPGCADSIDRTNLEALPTYTSATGFTYAVDAGVPADVASMGLLIDMDWSEWVACMAEHLPEINTAFERIQPYRIIVVAEEFRCKFHAFYCGGEYSDNPPRIYLAYDTAAGAPIKYSWHEWSDILNPATEDYAGRDCVRNL